jgi:MoxR-like ATPase
MLVRTLAETIHATFSRVQFTPDLMPADIVGTNVITEDHGVKRFEFQKGPIFANIVLADEINRATPKTQSALLEAMSEGSVTVAKQTYLLEKPFFVLATQNPLEMEGTYPLPEAQLDRVLLQAGRRVPRQAVAPHDPRSHHDRRRAEAAAGDREGAHPRDARARAARAARAPDPGLRRCAWCSRPTRRTRSDAAVKQFMRYGASPRGLQAIILAAKIRALLEGRYAVAIDDIRHVASPALRHRMILNFEGEAEGVEPTRSSPRS